MERTTKTPGNADEHLSRVDDRWKGQYDATAPNMCATPRTLAENINVIFGAVHEDVVRRGHTDDEIAADVKQALAEVRAERSGKPPYST